MSDPLKRNMFVVVMTIHHLGEDGEIDRPFVVAERFVTDEVVEYAAIPVLPLALREVSEMMIRHVEEEGV